MSEATSRSAARRATQHQEKDTSTMDTHSTHTAAASHDGANGANVVRLPAETVTLEIAGLQVTLPRKFSVGHVLTENQARVLDAAYQRQFTNNQTASAKARSDAYDKATTDAERAAKMPLTAEQIAALYADYEPNVGREPRQSSVEKMRYEAAWRAWVSMVQEHNRAVATGGAPVITKAGNKPVTLMSAPRLPAGSSEAARKANAEAFAEAKHVFLSRMLERPEYAEVIQVQLDAIMAESGAKKVAKITDAVESGADLL